VLDIDDNVVKAFREKNASVGAAYSTEEAFLNRIDFEDTVIKQ